VPVGGRTCLIHFETYYRRRVQSVMAMTHIPEIGVHFRRQKPVP